VLLLLLLLSLLLLLLPLGMVTGDGLMVAAQRVSSAKLEVEWLSEAGCVKREYRMVM
jgi:hypothetical protein